MPSTVSSHYSREKSGANPDFSPPNDTLEELGKGGALQAAEKQVPADNHPVARRATPPDPGGELLKTLPSSVEEGWRAERRGGCNRRKFKRQGVFPQPVWTRPSKIVVRNPG